MSAMSATAAATRSNGPLARDLGARQRPARQLQAGHRAEFRELYLFELVQDLLGADVDLDRQRHERLGAALDGLGLRPRQQQEDGVGLEAAHAGDGLGEIAIEHGVPRLGGGGGGNRGQEAAADDVDAVGPRLIAVDEAVDVGAGADQENALRRDQSGGARNRGDAHDEEAQADEADQRRGIEQHDPGARIFDAGLRQEADHQQADQRDVPHLNGAANVRLEPAEIRQPVFCAIHVGHGKDGGRQNADLHEQRDVAGLAVGGEVIGDAGEAGHRHDEGNVGEEDRGGKGAAQQHRPRAQVPAGLRPGSQRVARVRVHCLCRGLAKANPDSAPN